MTSLKHSYSSQTFKSDKLKKPSALTGDEFAKSTVYEWIGEELEFERSKKQLITRREKLRKLKTDEETPERQLIENTGTMNAVRHREYEAYQALLCYERKDYEWVENKTDDGVEFMVSFWVFEC